MSETFIICEIGSNFNNSIELAYESIKEAKLAGADAVKFQTYSADTLYAKSVSNQVTGTKNVHKLIDDISINRDWQPWLKEYADDLGIEWLSTPFDEAAVDELCDIGVSKLKIAAFESTDPRFVKMCADAGLPIIFSAGVNGVPKNTINWIRAVNSDIPISVLHCNSAYPTPVEDAKLNTIQHYIDEFYTPYNIHVGLSDHTESTIIPAAAVAMGATIIEKHCTLSKSLSGPDHPFALEFPQFKEMVKNIRDTEKARGFKVGNTSSEEKNCEITRSVYAKKTIKAGEKFSEDNITTMRPFIHGTNVPAKEYYSLLDCKSSYYYLSGDPINIRETYFSPET